jgi:hypothetical protein
MGADHVDTIAQPGARVEAAPGCASRYTLVRLLVFGRYMFCLASRCRAAFCAASRFSVIALTAIEPNRCTAS